MTLSLYDLWSRLSLLGSCPASGAPWSSAMPPSLGRGGVTTTPWVAADLKRVKSICRLRDSSFLPFIELNKFPRIFKVHALQLYIDRCKGDEHLAKEIPFLANFFIARCSRSEYAITCILANNFPSENLPKNRVQFHWFYCL